MPFKRVDGIDVKKEFGQKSFDKIKIEIYHMLI